MSVYLKIKLKSLAAEARIIKHEEAKRKVFRGRRNARSAHNTQQGVSNDECRETRAVSKARSAQRRSRDWYPKSAQELQQLHLHRINVVRTEARLTQIAYGYIRGRKLEQVDSGRGLTANDWQRVEIMLKKYGGGVGEALAIWSGRQQKAA